MSTAIYIPAPGLSVPAHNPHTFSYSAVRAPFRLKSRASKRRRVGTKTPSSSLLFSIQVLSRVHAVRTGLNILRNAHSIHTKELVGIKQAAAAQRREEHLRLRGSSNKKSKGLSVTSEGSCSRKGPSSLQAPARFGARALQRSQRRLTAVYNREAHLRAKKIKAASFSSSGEVEYKQWMDSQRVRHLLFNSTLRHSMADDLHVEYLAQRTSFARKVLMRVKRVRRAQRKAREALSSALVRKAEKVAQARDARLATSSALSRRLYSTPSESPATTMTLFRTKLDSAHQRRVLRLAIKTYGSRSEDAVQKVEDALGERKQGLPSIRPKASNKTPLPVIWKHFERPSKVSTVGKSNAKLQMAAERRAVIQAEKSRRGSVGPAVPSPTPELDAILRHEAVRQLHFSQYAATIRRQKTLDERVKTARALYTLRGVAAGDCEVVLRPCECFVDCCCGEDASPPTLTQAPSFVHWTPTRKSAVEIESKMKAVGSRRSLLMAKRMKAAHRGLPRVSSVDPSLPPCSCISPTGCDCGPNACPPPKSPTPTFHSEDSDDDVEIVSFQ